MKINTERSILDTVAEIGASDKLQDIRRITLDAIRKMVWFDTANFWVYPPLAREPEDFLFYLDSPTQSIQIYLQHFIHMDEFHQAYNQNQLVIARSSDMLDYSLWIRKSEYYHDFLKANQVYYILAFDIKDNDMAYGAICMHREKSKGDFLDSDILILKMLYPHLVNRFKALYQYEMISRKLSSIASEEHYASFHFSTLTIRERAIVQQVLMGKSNEEVAKNLGITINTVKMHLQNIYT